MLNNIYSVLDQAGFGALKRAIHVQFSHALLNTQVFLQRIDGHHALNDGLNLQLTCLSNNAHIALKQFIGCPVAVAQINDLGQFSRTSGIITQASQGQSDGALTLYTLTVQDPTALWHKRRNSRVFMNKSVPEITEILFKEWQAKSSLFAASLTLDLSGLGQNYDIRPFTMQNNETDHDFLTRLWRSEGINWLIDEQNNIVVHTLHDIEPQKLRLIDDQQHFAAMSRRVIRFHRSHATEYFDSMISLIAHRQLQSTAAYVQRWQADGLTQDEGSGSVLSAHLYSDQYNNESLSLEQAWFVSAAWTSDLTGADQATTSGSEQIERLNQNLSAYQEIHAKYFKAQTTVRDAQVGYWFELTGHPEIDQHSGSDRQFLIYEKRFYNQNNLPKDIQQQSERLMSRTALSSLQKEERQGNELNLIRRQIKVVPEYQPLQHRPSVYPQRARVVGPENEEIYVDEWGRIKVRFLFTRDQDHAHDGGAGANENEGDVDRPFVVGRIHEAERHQTMFDVKGKLPLTKKLSGIRSQEVNGEGFNQLRFDDTTGQISTQLQTFVTDEPNYFYNIDKKTITSIRGYGFELSKNQIMYNNGKIRGVDLIGNGIPNIITECFSSEGSHFNIWGGANNEEKLLHRYTFLDMNMQASCTENDKIFSPGLLDLKK